jgi:hypothetical protein
MNKKDGLLINSSHKRNSAYIHQDWYWNYKLGREPWKKYKKMKPLSLTFRISSQLGIWINHTPSDKLWPRRAFALEWLDKLRVHARCFILLPLNIPKPVKSDTSETYMKIKKTSGSFWEKVYKGTQTADLLPRLFVLLMTVERNNLLWTHLEFCTLANNRD